MSIKLNLPKLSDLKPRITVIGIGGAGCNAINNMIASGLNGVDFVVANTDAQALAASSAEHSLQLGVNLTEGLGAGARPEIGQAAAEEAIEEIRAQISGSHMVFLAAGMGGGTGTGAAAVIARVAREQGILTVGVVTKPFHFEGRRRMRVAEAGIEELRATVDTLIVIPNQNLFLIANEKTSFGEAFLLADQVLYSGVACIVDLILKEGLINLDFADVRAVMADMGTAMMGTGEAGGENRAKLAAEEAISNPLLDDVSLRGAKGLLLSITGGRDLRLFDVEAAASRVREEVDPEANIIVGATFDETLGERIRVSIVASGMAREKRTDAPVSSSQADSSQMLANHVPAERSDIASGQLPSYDHAASSSVMPPPIPSGASPDIREPMPGIQPGLADAPRTHMESEGRQPESKSGESWDAPGNVTIEVGAPMFASATTISESPQAEALPNSAPQDDFSLQPPPEDIRRVSTRIPEISEFPPVGQRIYRAHQSMDAAHGAEDGGNERKAGLVDRLKVLGRKPLGDSRQNTFSEGGDSGSETENGNDGHNHDQIYGVRKPRAKDHAGSPEPIENSGPLRRRRS